MIYEIREFFKKIISSRVLILMAIFSVMFALVLGRVFYLQIVKGESYRENFALRIQKTIAVDASRGNIYDCNGTLLAYNELAYVVTIIDNTSYTTTSARNRALNAELAELIGVIEGNGESINNDFGILYNPNGTYSFRYSGTSLKRFKADVFGKSSYDKLTYNKEFGFNEADATPDQIMEYLMHNNTSGFFLNKSNIEVDEYDPHTNYEIVVLRYAMNSNRYTKYKATVVAENVGDKTVAYMSEHSDTLKGVEIIEDSIRKYNYSEYFASIIGYTGKITNEEYTSLSEKDSTYTMNDTVGRSGLEAYYESYLRGVNGKKEVYVDNVGRISEVISNSDPVAGDDLYISIDANLQEATYRLLEQEIAGIVYSNIRNGKIPLNDVYFALINNNVIDSNHFSKEDASTTEQSIYATYEVKCQDAIGLIEGQLLSERAQTINAMNEETLDYFTDVISFLKDEDILDTSAIDTSDAVYVNWRNGTISPQEYLRYAIANQWIDITLMDIDDKYSDTSEIYNAMVEIIRTDLPNYAAFQKNVYKYMIKKGSVSGRDLCMVLFDQGVLEYDEEAVSSLGRSTSYAYTFILNKINNIEITPAQLALDPCTGSSIITDANTGEIKALVSYPGYDNNKLANGVDAVYYAKLNADKSNPLYNYATQEKTAPGSTFKMVSSTAGLAENMIDTSTRIKCLGIFTDISNTPKCWIYPSAHANINVSEALRDSCNYFYYSVGFKLACKDDGAYDDPSGIAYLQKYASIYGLNRKTGLEIEENLSEMADEYPVMAAIGQSNNNYTTAALARYVTAVTTGRLYEYQLMSQIVNADGDVVKAYAPDYEDISNTLTNGEWSAIRYGMRLVCESMKEFDNSAVAIAGKTGTAQQVKTRPNHALFVGYAPYNNPEVTIATRIAYGYSSHNAAEASKKIFDYYFKAASLEDILSGKAESAGGNSSTTVTD